MVGAGVLMLFFLFRDVCAHFAKKRAQTGHLWPASQVQFLALVKIKRLTLALAMHICNNVRT
jgi:hypothetical protein